MLSGRSDSSGTDEVGRVNDTTYDEQIRTTRAKIRRVSVSSMDNNSYLVTCSTTGEQLLIDAADDAPRLLRMIEDGGGRLAVLVTSHRHADHTRALADVVAALHPETAAGEDDADALPVPVRRRLRHGDELRVGELVLRVVHLRGHTPGSVTLVLPGDHEAAEPDRLFTGDSLFPGGPGRTWSSGDFVSLMDDLETRIFAAYPDDAVVHPGHGLPTTLGRERPHLGAWRERGW
jgi:glyoxylase-like metal-dependent hydrolase (beta-lactamase superfamily II)